jgi:hypothetical protein
MSKSTTSFSSQEVESLVEKLLSAKKYRGVSIPRETLANLVD